MDTPRREDVGIQIGYTQYWLWLKLTVRMRNLIRTHAEMVLFANCVRDRLRCWQGTTMWWVSPGDSLEPIVYAAVQSVAREYLDDEDVKRKAAKEARRVQREQDQARRALDAQLRATGSAKAEASDSARCRAAAQRVRKAYQREREHLATFEYPVVVLDRLPEQSPGHVIASEVDRQASYLERNTPWAIRQRGERLRWRLER